MVTSVEVLLADLLTINSPIMRKVKRTKREEFVVEISHAFAKYGIVVKDDTKTSLCWLHAKTIEELTDNINEIADLSLLLSFAYDND